MKLHLACIAALLGSAAAAAGACTGSDPDIAATSPDGGGSSDGRNGTDALGDSPSDGGAGEDAKPTGPPLGAYAPIAGGAKNVLVAPMPNGGAILFAQFGGALTAADASIAGDVSGAAFLMRVDSSLKPLWVKRFLGVTYADALATDPTGNGYVALRSSAAQFGQDGHLVTSGISGSGSPPPTDGLVVKVSPDGDHLWDFHTSANTYQIALATSPDGKRLSVGVAYTYLLHYPNDTVDGGFGSYPGSPTPEAWLAVVTYDDALKFQWLRVIWGPSGTKPVPTAMALGASYDAYVALTMHGAKITDGNGGNDFPNTNDAANATLYVARLSGSEKGAVKNAQPLPVTTPEGATLALGIDGMGRPVACGHFKGQITLRSTNGAHGGTSDTDGFVAVFDQSVTKVVDDLTLGGSGEDICSGIAFPAADEMLVAGAFSSSNLALGGTSFPTPAQAKAAYLARLDGAHAPIWVRKIDDNFSSASVPPSIARSTTTGTFLASAFQGVNLDLGLDGGSVTSGDAGASASSYLTDFGE